MALGIEKTHLLIAMVASVLIGLGLLVQLARASRRLRATGGPGMAPFQLAEGDREANRFLRAWGPAGRATAKRLLMWQFGIVVCYVVALGAAALHIASRADGATVSWVALPARLAAMLTVAAGVANCVGNVALLAQLRAQRATRGWMFLSRWCARFTVTATGLACLGVLGGFGVVQLAG